MANTYDEEVRCTTDDSKIGHHQVSYEAVTSLTSETFRSAEGMYLPTITANWNGPLAAFNRHIDGATYMT